MKQIKIPIRGEKKTTEIVSLNASSNLYFGVALSLGILITGLLCGASLRVGNMQIATPAPTNPHMLLENQVRKVVRGFPIEAMASQISRKNKTTAAFLVGIAKKESNWGKRVPRDDFGADCYNYWGYRGAGSRGIEMGHGCFGSPEEAIGIVGGRLDTLVMEYKFKTPSEMIVWKCGFSCDGHSPESVKKWISDVGFYFDKVDKRASN